MNDAPGKLTYIAPVFRVQDLKRSLAFYRDQLGFPFAVPLREMPYGVEFYIRDPDGYILGFVQPTPE